VHLRGRDYAAALTLCFAGHAKEREMSIRNTIGYTFCAALLLTSSAVLAAPAAVRKQVEASMLVTGSIQVDGEGKVTGFALDQKEKLPEGVVGLLDKAVPTWKFAPVLVAGRPAHVTTEMSVRLVAKQIEGDNFTLAVRSASFGDHAERNPKRVKSDRKPKDQAADSCAASLRPPRYPSGAGLASVAANVYLLIKTDRNGRVLDAVAEQVNLKVADEESSMARWRKQFADVSLAQARRWCIPPSGEDLMDTHPYFVVRVPVMFHFESVRYGQWEAYVPGPRTPNPWDDEDEGVAFSPDTLLPGRAYVAGSGLKLLTNPNGS
jgi:hypothetical protein